jgi:hypothetical protein
MVFYLKAIDAAGNVTIVERRWTQEDITAPVISTGGIQHGNTPDSAQVRFTANEPATFECALRRIDQSEWNWQPCTSPHRYENLTWRRLCFPA